MHDDIADKVMRALRGDDPRVVRGALERILKEAPQRLDVQHAMAVTELRLGQAEAALNRLDAAERQARDQADETAGTMMGVLLLSKAAACEDLADPAGAEACYRQVMANEEGNPRAFLGLAYLLMAWGRGDEGARLLQTYIVAALDDPQAMKGNGDFLGAWNKVIADDVHPRMFLEAHRGAYVEFFDHHAAEVAPKGWVAEAARMRRDEDGQVVPVIPDGARPYAAVRVDLVDPATGQVGLVGDQPMIVALAGFEPLARAPSLLSWPRAALPFP
ncbi:MAG: hypothetical protein GXP62_13965, partial [Oligoflexia bacterium]|nr:hypothetical protein [Oligoflexia bacterium]